MGKNHINNLLHFCQSLYNEIDTLNTLAVMTKSYCTDKEFTGEYYSLKNEISLYLSEERNHYINMLTLVAESALKTRTLCESIENELCLHNNPDDCCG